MPDIQTKVMKYKTEFEPDPYTDGQERRDLFLAETDLLIRSILEKCLGEIEFWRKCGNSMDSPEMLEWIRQQFAWLPEK